MKAPRHLYESFLTWAPLMAPHRSGHEARLPDPWPLWKATKRQQKKPQNASCFNPCSDFVLHSCWYRHWFSAAACTTPSLPLPLSGYYTGEVGDKLIRATMMHGWGKTGAGRRRDNLCTSTRTWRVRQEMYRERSAGRQWEGGKMVQEAVFIMTEEEWESVGFEKPKKEER